MVKILHIADVHLDHSFGKYTESVRMILSEAQLKTFMKAINEAINNKVDVLLIAGDLFHGKVFTFRTERVLKEGFAKLEKAGIPCIYATGNHDPLTVLDRFRKMKTEMIHIFGDEDIKVFNRLSRDGTPFRVIGCGHGEKGEGRPLVDDYPIKDGEVTIGIAHSMLASGSKYAEDNYMPVTLEELKRKNYDYFALGHIHKREIVTEKIAYSGCTQGIKSTEVGPKGGHLVTIDDYGTHIEFIELAHLRMQEIHVDISDADTFDSLISHVNAALMLNDDYPRIQTVLRVYLEGQSGLYRQLSGEVLESLTEEIQSEGFLHVSVDVENLKPIKHLSEAVMAEGMVQAVKDVLKIPEFLVEHLQETEPFKGMKLSDDELKQYLFKFFEKSGESIIERLVKEHE